jgi:hypothetical protein
LTELVISAGKTFARGSWVMDELILSSGNADPRLITDASDQACASSNSSPHAPEYPISLTLLRIRTLDQQLRRRVVSQ